MRKILLTLALIIFAVPALAQAKVTADPNATSVTVAKSDSDKEIQTDARLLQKVTLSESRRTVSAILDDLTKSTRVTFKAGYNNNDWQVRDRKMCVFAKNLPLTQIMNSISHVMKFKWERKGEDGEWQYRLYMDRKTLLDADSQRLREDERMREKATEKRQIALEDYSNVDNLMPEDMAKLKEKDPLMYVFATTGIAGSLGQMFREVPAMSEAMAAGQAITMSGADMSEQGRAGLGRLIGGIANLAKLLKQGGDGMFDSIDMTKVDVSLNQDLDRQAGGMPQYLLLAMVNIKFSEHAQANFPLMNPDSNIGLAVGKALVRCVEGQSSIEDLNKDANGDFQKAMLSDTEAGKKEYGEQEIQHPDDPALKVKVKLHPEGQRLADVQKALAEASSFAIISDSFGKLEHPSQYSFTKDENELGTVLDKLTKGVFYNWDKRSGVLEFRDKEWFRKRSAQIPEATIEGWRQAFTKTGTLDLPDLAEIARLDVEQTDMNVGEDEILGSMDIRGLIWMHRDILRLYASLTDNQRSAALSEAGLDFQALSAEQYAAAQEILKNRNTKFLRNPDAQVTLKITSEKKDKQFHYTFTIATTDEVPPIKGEFTTPKYEEPKKPEKPEDKAKPADPANPGQNAK